MSMRGLSCQTIVGFSLPPPPQLYLCRVQDTTFCAKKRTKLALPPWEFKLNFGPLGCHPERDRERRFSLGVLPEAV